jgi:hypothetical protein
MNKIKTGYKAFEDDNLVLIGTNVGGGKSIFIAGQEKVMELSKEELGVRRSLANLNVFIMRNRADFMYRISALENLVISTLGKVCSSEEDFASLYKPYQTELFSILEVNRKHYDEMLKEINEKSNLNNRTYRDDMTVEEVKDLAYYERNMIALRYADGWYYDTDNNWDGWKRVLSLDGGKMCFHIPDDFKVGDLQQIEPSWDGHTTEEKWARIDKMRDIK